MIWPGASGAATGAARGRPFQIYSFRAGENGKGAGVGMGHGPHQIIDGRGGLAPVDASVFGRASAEIGGLGVVLGEPGGLAGRSRG